MSFSDKTDEPFPSSRFAPLADSESTSWWFNSRNQIILTVLNRFATPKMRYLEVGCGNGFVLQAVAQAYPSFLLTASEFYAEPLKTAAKRVKRCRFLTQDIRTMDFSECFDVVSAFDVLEHIQEDTIALQNISRAIVPGGHVLLTVPQHRLLWSHLDSNAHHVRRYSRHDLARKLSLAGFKPIWSSSFFTLTLPIYLLSNLISSILPSRQSSAGGVNLPKIISSFLLSLMQIERLAISLGISLPIGSSLIILAKKTAPPITHSGD